MSQQSNINKFINKESFCVVGNSPIEIGSGNGKRIDSYASIIRFNDFSLSFSHDYGKKVNIWVRASNDQVIETLDLKKNIDFDLILFRNFNKRNQGSVDYYNKNNQQINEMPIEYEIKLSNKLKSIPSTGLLFLFYLKENGYSFDNNVFGFSFFDKSEIKNYKTNHYYNFEKNKVSKGIELARHNWKNESLFFKKYILGKK